jgi:flagellar protein FlgJ
MTDFLANAATLAPQAYNDLSGLNALKLKSRENPENAVGEVAQQFESIFITMMMKAMRDTLPKDGMFASSQMDTYQNGLGLAAVIERQLSAASRYQPAEPGLIQGADASQAGGLVDSSSLGDESHG